MKRMPSEERLTEPNLNKMAAHRLNHAETKQNGGKQLSVVKQYIFSIIVSFGCVCAGTLLAWTSPVLPHITSTLTTNLTSIKPNLTQNLTSTTVSIKSQAFQVTESEASLIGSIVAIGAVIGALPAGYIAKQLSIKLQLHAIAILFIVCWAGTMYHALDAILLARFIGGVATGAVCVCVPIYTSSIASVSIRGVLGSFFQVSFCFGILLVNFIGGRVSWAELSYYMIVLPGIYFVALLFVPGIDLGGKNQENEIGIELSEMPKDGATLQNFWNEIKSNRRQLLCGLGLVSFQQLSGVNAVIFYTGNIFAAGGSSVALSADVSTVIVTGAQLIFSIVSASLIEKLPRRWYLMISAGGMSVSLFLLGAYFLTKPLLPALLPLVSLVLFFVTYCAGYGPLPWLMLGEIFSERFKSIGCSVATTFNWLLVFGVTSVFPLLCAAVGEGYTFAIFGACNFAAGVFTWWVVPETRGRSSEQIQMAFANGK